MGEYIAYYEYWSQVSRFLHVLFGIAWIGLLYYFNFIGGGYFIWTSILLAIKKTKSGAMKNFFGSFVQLGLLLILIIIDGIII